MVALEDVFDKSFEKNALFIRGPRTWATEAVWRNLKQFSYKSPNRPDKLSFPQFQFLSF